LNCVEVVVVEVAVAVFAAVDEQPQSFERKHSRPQHPKKRGKVNKNPQLILFCRAFLEFGRAKLAYGVGLSFYRKFTGKSVKLFNRFTGKIRSVNSGKYLTFSVLICFLYP